MLQGKAIRQVLMQAVDTAHCAMFVTRPSTTTTTKTAAAALLTTVATTNTGL